MLRGEVDVRHEALVIPAGALAAESAGAIPLTSRCGGARSPRAVPSWSHGAHPRRAEVR